MRHFLAQGHGKAVVFERIAKVDRVQKYVIKINNTQRNTPRR
jgi:hypothetical protein